MSTKTKTEVKTAPKMPEIKKQYFGGIEKRGAEVIIKSMRALANGQVREHVAKYNYAEMQRKLAALPKTGDNGTRAQYRGLLMPLTRPDALAIDNESVNAGQALHSDMNCHCYAHVARLHGRLDLLPNWALTPSERAERNPATPAPKTGAKTPTLKQGAKTPARAIKTVAKK